jgi:DNA repair protein RadC
MTEKTGKPLLYEIPVYDVRLVRARRPLRLVEERLDIDRQAARALHALIGLTDREHFVCLFVNNANVIAGAHIAAMGGQNTCVVDGRVVMRAAFAACASALVVGHNHLSGDPTPSAEDLAMTAKLMSIGNTVGVPVLDHVIVTRDPRRYHAMFTRGTLPKIEP